MCSDCFDDEAGPADPPDPVRLALAARHIERDLGGDPVPERAWAIYLGAASGAVDWRSMQRMARCMEAAQVLLAAASPHSAR